LQGVVGLTLLIVKQQSPQRKTMMQDSLLAWTVVGVFATLSDVHTSYRDSLSGGYFSVRIVLMIPSSQYCERLSCSAGVMDCRLT